MPLMPSWLYYLLAIAMLSIAAYSLVLLALAALSRRTPGWDVHVSHVAMGVAMAGMFVNGWSFGPSTIWEITFAALLIWFVVSTSQSLLEYGVHLPHTAIHGVMSLAMLLMYWFPMGSSPNSMSMSMSSSTGGRVDPGLAFVIASLLLIYAVFTLASPSKGQSVYGSHLALSVSDESSVALNSGPVLGSSLKTLLPGTVSSAGGFEGTISRPLFLDVAHVVMTVAMGFMLILML
jgi:Domain of unknown function (DUF5134)